MWRLLDADCTLASSSNVIIHRPTIELGIAKRRIAIQRIAHSTAVLKKHTQKSNAPYKCTETQLEVVFFSFCCYALQFHRWGRTFVIVAAAENNLLQLRHLKFNTLPCFRNCDDAKNPKLVTIASAIVRTHAYVVPVVLGTSNSGVNELLECRETCSRGDVASRNVILWRLPFFGQSLNVANCRKCYHLSRLIGTWRLFVRFLPVSRCVFITRPASSRLSSVDVWRVDISAISRLSGDNVVVSRLRMAEHAIFMSVGIRERDYFYQQEAQRIRRLQLILKSQTNSATETVARTAAAAAGI